MTAKESLAALISEHKIGMATVFVPWSQSRNAKEKTPSLNWRVTLTIDGREIIASDYMAGCGHCPAYKQGRRTVYDQENVRFECENGKRCQPLNSGQWLAGRELKPDIADVLSAFLMDAAAIDHPTFESWARDMGGNPDNISEQRIYQTCIETALKLRNSLGNDLFEQMRKLAQEM